MVIMHVWFIGLRGHHGEIAGRHMVRSLFLLLEFFCLVAILETGSGVWYSGIFGLGGLDILGLLPILLTWILRFSMLEVSSLMVIWPWILVLIFLLLLNIV